VTANRVAKAADVLRAAGEWRARGERVALADGAFDLLSPEHARFLAEVRAGVGRLVVVVLDDRAAAERLGPGRPVTPAAERARLVAALRGVDRVVLCDRTGLETLANGLDPARRVSDFEDRSGAERIARVRAGRTES
jgi:bifunctional ADP-heptose synthase (sugar kinase/adenylyltransferase)